MKRNGCGVDLAELIGSALGCSGIALICIGPWLLLSFWTNYNLDFWVSYFKEKPVDVPFWIAMVMSAVMAPLTLLANIVGEIAKFFI